MSESEIVQKKTTPNTGLTRRFIPNSNVVSIFDSPSHTLIKGLPDLTRASAR